MVRIAANGRNMCNSIQNQIRQIWSLGSTLQKSQQFAPNPEVTHYWYCCNADSHTSYDMTDRLTRCHQMFDTESSCNYELKHVGFYSVDTVSLNDATPGTESRPTPHTAVASTLLVNPVMETETVQSSQFSLISVQSHDCSNNDSNLTARAMNSTFNILFDDLLQGVSTDMISVSSVMQQEVHKVFIDTQT